jgi:hypothetical protein
LTTTTDVPARVPVAINGHGYMADPVVRETVQVIRQQADTTTEAGEQTLNRQGLWLRSQESWHHGAGQDFLDGAQDGERPDTHRFRTSKGIDPWTKGQLSLHHPTLKAWSTSSTNLHLAQAWDGITLPYLYLSDGTEVYANTLPFGGLNTLALQTGTGWTATNATLSASPTNVGMMRVTGTASGVLVTVTSPTGTGGVPVDGGRSYARIAASRGISGSGAKTVTVTVKWYDSGGAHISDSTTATAATNDAVVSTAGNSVTAPANAAFAAIVISWTTNWTSGDVHDAVANIGPADLTGVVAGPDVWNTVNVNAGQAAQTVQSLTSNGTYVWAAMGTSGLHRIWNLSATADVPAAPASGQVSLVGWANGFLLAAGSAGVASNRENSLWLVTGPLDTPALSLIKTHPNPSYKWTFISGGRNCVYAGGNSGTNGEIYKILFDPNTGTLSTAASPASFLPDGETIYSLQFYAGGIIMGTGKGLRIGTADGAGNIDYGPLIPTTWPVRCLEPQDRYCWFGWTRYDATNSGLGRVDLGFLTDTLTPAWASDLMTSDSSTGDVVAAVTFAPYGFSSTARPPIRFFTVAGEGLYAEDVGSRVLTGTLETGMIRFSTSEPKTTRSLDVRHHALPAGGPISAEMQRDSSGTWTSVGSSSTTGSYGPAAPLDLQDLNAEGMEFRFTLDRPDNDGTDYSRSPELTRWTAKVLPTPSTIDETFTIPIIMRARALTGQADGTPWDIDVAAEIAYLKGLERSRALIDIQIGSETISDCYVAASQFKADMWNDDRTVPEGVYTVQISTARG